MSGLILNNLASERLKEALSIQWEPFEGSVLYFTPGSQEGEWPGPRREWRRTMSSRNSGNSFRAIHRGKIDGREVLAGRERGNSLDGAVVRGGIAGKKGSVRPKRADSPRGGRADPSRDCTARLEAVTDNDKAEQRQMSEANARLNDEWPLLYYFHAPMPGSSFVLLDFEHRGRPT
ncbi:hypothetical protein KM043_005106 [Ampulex compressa]|nr:hypothetical protein KM043_005106 [Ampulex compressa]